MGSQVSISPQLGLLAAEVVAREVETRTVPKTTHEHLHGQIS